MKTPLKFFNSLILLAATVGLAACGGDNDDLLLGQRGNDILSGHGNLP